MLHVIALLVLGLFAASVSAGADSTVTTTWGGGAEKVYDNGFMHMLMKNPGGGVSLFRMDLVENDSPGAGFSEKGPSTDSVWGNIRARKVLVLDDPRAHGAWLVAFPGRRGRFPLEFTLNGKHGSVENWDSSVKNREEHFWNPFPPEWLRKGENVIEFFCPAAATEKEGWSLYLARADEFANGGGDPANVGKTSFKSADGGKTWRESPFGPDGKTRAEYSVRLSLDRYVKTGWLASPVIDLWKGDSDDVVFPLREIRKMRLTIRADVPAGATVDYYFRRGTNPQPFSDDWEAYRSVGSGASLDFTTGGADLNRRYVQFKAVLATVNPLVSPVIREAKVESELLERTPSYQNIHVVSADNPPIRYSSANWEWEKWDRPEFRELRTLENLDEVVAGSRTEFDAQVKILDYVTKRWRHAQPTPGYPGWDAKSILDRIGYAGAGGMCIQFNNTVSGLCMTYGWQARLVNVVNHEVCEVWNDEYGKWIFLDADYEDNYNYSPDTAEPLSMLEIHRRYLDYYFPDRPIDWLNDTIKWMDVPEEKDPPVKRGSLTHTRTPKYRTARMISGFVNAAFVRVVPRNNWYEKPFPCPLTHGMTLNWNGYLNWYDERTPPNRNYTWHTDRPRDIWPDLNRVHADVTQGFGNDRLFLRFETYTPSFSHYEVAVDDTGWKEVGERWTWLLQSGRNTLQIRAVSMLGVRGKPSSFVVNHADAPFAE